MENLADKLSLFQEIKNTKKVGEGPLKYVQLFGSSYKVRHVGVTGKVWFSTGATEEVQVDTEHLKWA